MTLQQIVGTWDRTAFSLAPNPEELPPLAFWRQPTADDEGQMIPSFGTAELAGIARSCAASGYDLVSLTFMPGEDIRGSADAWEQRMLHAARAGEWQFGADYETDEQAFHDMPSVYGLTVHRNGVTSEVAYLGRYNSPSDELFTTVIVPHLHEQWSCREQPPRRSLMDVLLRRGR